MIDVVYLEPRAGWRGYGCEFCGTTEDACCCRYCRSCSQVWVAALPLKREYDGSPDASAASRHGLRAVECPECEASS